MEDTYNLLGHALRKALGIIARQQGRELTAIAFEAGVSLLGGASLKAALTWTGMIHQRAGIGDDSVHPEDSRGLVGTCPTGSDHPQVSASLAAAEQVRQQDVEVTAEGKPKLRQRGEGAAHRHRRCPDASRAQEPEQRIDGYKRHVLHDLDSGPRASRGGDASQRARSERHGGD